MEETVRESYQFNMGTLMERRHPHVTFLEPGTTFLPTRGDLVEFKRKYKKWNKNGSTSDSV